MELSRNKLTALDILNQASGHISAVAANCGIDFDKLYPLITKGQTDYHKGIAIDRKYNGKVKAWVNFKTTLSGQEYPVIRFNTLKHGGYSESFDGFKWLLDQQGFGINLPSQKPAPRPAVIKEANSDRQYKINRFNKFQSVYNALPTLTDFTNTYLERKGFTIDDLPPSFIIKRGNDDRGWFIAYPLVNGEGTTVGYQKIYDKHFIDSSGVSRDKDFVFLPDSKNGSFALLGQSRGDTVNLAEGLATALTIYAATGVPTAICLDAGNLIHAATALKKTFNTLIVCADNDVSDNRGNVGIDSAIRAAQAVGSEYIVYPELDGKKIDFNDLYLLSGIDVVRHQLEHNRIDLHGNISPLLVKYAPGNQPVVEHVETKLNTRFLPDNIFNDGVTIVKATYGTGKTFAVSKYIEDHLGESVLYIAHLQTLCGQAASRFAIENYGDHKSGLHEHPCLSICINSTFKLLNNDTLPAYDVIVLDEIEQLLARLTGTGKDAIEHKVLVFSVLMRLIKTAKKVICLDADISKRTFDFIESCRPNEGFNFINNVYKNEKNLYVYGTELEVINLAKEAIANGEPALFATNSMNNSEQILGLINQKNGLSCYPSETLGTSGLQTKY